MGTDENDKNRVDGALVMAFCSFTLYVDHIC